MKVLTIAGANLRRFIRDKSNTFFVFVLPIGIVLLIGAQFGGDFSPRIGVVSPPNAGELTASIVDDLAAQEDLTLVTYDNEDALLLAVERGHVSAGLVIPTDLDGAVGAGDTSEVGFVSRPDGIGPQLQSVVAKAVARAVEPVVAVRYAVAQGADPADAAAAAEVAMTQAPEVGVEVTTAGSSIFPSDMGQFDIGASSQLVLFMFLTGLTGSAAVIQTRHLGVATRMMSTPTPVRTIILGEALGRFVIVLVQGLYIMAATILIFQVNWGDPLGAAAILVAFALVGAGGALLFGTVFSNDQQAGGVGIVAGIGLAAIGGSMLPLELFSDTMLRVARFTPHAWANEAFAELVRRDGSFVDILPELGVMAAFGVAFLVVASWRMRTVITRA